MLAIAMVALLVEGVMQVAAYVIWSQQRKPVLPATGKTVLCVGDSWTHGMGSLDCATGSYPARLQALLREHGATDWNVVNGGQSGQNSRDVLERLPSQIADYHPQIVCVLVGQNDFWSQPQQVADDERATVNHSAYRFRWRLPRLLMWAIGNIRGVGKAPKMVRDPEQWKPRQVPVAADPYRNEPGTWLWTEAIGKQKADCFQKFGARDFPAALAIAESLCTETPDDPQVHGLLAQTLFALGRQADSARELDWLRTTWRERPGFWVGNSLVNALLGNGFWQECRDVATAHLAKFPEAAWVWRARAESEFQIGLIDDALVSIDRAIRLTFDRWFHFLHYKILMFGKKDPDAAIRALFDLYELDNDAEYLAQYLLALEARSLMDRAVQLARTHDCEPATRARMVEIAEECLRNEDKGRIALTLAKHLERLFVAARNAGAEPVMLSYPWRNVATATLRKAAAAHDVTFLDVEAEFATRTVGRPRMELTAPDGHCNDEGYAIMANIVEERLLPLVQARSR